VTRVEIARCVEWAFELGSLSRDALVALSRRGSEHPETSRVLEALPNRVFHRMPEMWPHLAHIAVDDSSRTPPPARDT